jgi:hypothetical protein
MKSKILALAAVVCLFSTSAFAVLTCFDPQNPTWTYQYWSFTTQADDVVTNGQKSFNVNPDTFTNPNGQPTGTFKVTSYYRPSGWFVTHNNGQGIIYGDYVDLSLYIPNSQNRLLTKEICIEVHFLGTYLADKTYITAPQGFVPELSSREITYDTPNIPHPEQDSWKLLEEHWTINPQPGNEIINMSFTGTGADIDWIKVETICIPEPLSISLFAMASMFLLKRKQ